MNINFENEDLLKVESRSVIPDYVMSFSEAALYVAESVTEDYNSLMESIGVNELVVYESTGMGIVYEGERLNKLKEAIIKFFQDAWRSIKGFFERILDWFETKRKESIKKLETNIKSADLSKLPNDTVFGNMHKYGEFIKEAQAIENNTDSFLRYVEDQFEKICRNVDSSNKESKKQVQEDGQRLRDELSKDVIKKISGHNVDSMDEAKKAIEDRLVGDEIEINKNNISNHLSDLVKVVTDGKANEVIKRLYKSSRKMIDDAVKRARKYDDSRVLCANKEIYIYREIMSCSTALIGKVMDIYKRQFTEYRNMLVKVNIKAGKIKKIKESTGWSAVDEQINLVESILNF